MNNKYKKVFIVLPNAKPLFQEFLFRVGCANNKLNSYYKEENLHHGHVLITVNIFSIKRK